MEPGVRSIHPEKALPGNERLVLDKAKALIVDEWFAWCGGCSGSVKLAEASCTCQHNECRIGWEWILATNTTDPSSLPDHLPVVFEKEYDSLFYDKVLGIKAIDTVVLNPDPGYL